jgi:hypothetical protein
MLDYKEAKYYLEQFIYVELYAGLQENSLPMYSIYNVSWEKCGNQGAGISM